MKIVSSIDLQPAYRKHIPELDGLRGLAVSLVIIEHFWPTFGFWTKFSTIAELGWIGVDLFFVLSGFLITGILVDTVNAPDYFRRFYTRRAFRVFPLYYVFLTLLVAFLAVWHHGVELSNLRTEWGSPAWFFVYLGNFVTIIKGKAPLYGPLGALWSLQIEEQFYLVFPSVVRWCRIRLVPTLTLIALSSLAWRTALFFFNPTSTLEPFGGTFSRLDSLALGGLAAVLLRREEQRKLQNVISWLFPALLASLCVLYLQQGTNRGTPLTRTIGYSLNALVFSTLIIWIVQRQGETATSLFRLTPMRQLGKISYGVYLLQMPIQSIVKALAKSPLMGTMSRTSSISAVSIAATILIASLSFRYFEKPLQDFGKELFESGPEEQPRRSRADAPLALS